MLYFVFWILSKTIATPVALTDEFGRDVMETKFVLVEHRDTLHRFFQSRQEAVAFYEHGKKSVHPTKPSTVFIGEWRNIGRIEWIYLDSLRIDTL